MERLELLYSELVFIYDCLEKQPDSEQKQKLMDKINKEIQYKKYRV